MIFICVRDFKINVGVPPAYQFDCSAFEGEEGQDAEHPNAPMHRPACVNVQAAFSVAACSALFRRQKCSLFFAGNRCVDATCVLERASQLS